MAYVELRQNESLESGIRRWKKKLDNEGTLKTYKDKQYYKKPSEVRREKKKEAERKRKIEELKAEKAKHQPKKRYKKFDKNRSQNRSQNRSRNYRNRNEDNRDS